MILAEGDYVIVHGRFSNIGLPVNWIAADIVRLKAGILVEHWDCHSGRGYRATVQERESDVRRLIPEVNTTGTSLNKFLLALNRDKPWLPADLAALRLFRAIFRLFARS